MAFQVATTNSKGTPVRLEVVSLHFNILKPSLIRYFRLLFDEGRRLVSEDPKFRGSV